MSIVSSSEQDHRKTEKRRLEDTIQDLEFKKSSLERKLKAQEDELTLKQDEISGLKVNLITLQCLQQHYS